MGVIVIVWQLDLQLLYLYAISAYNITTKVVSSNPTNGEVYSIQHYVMVFSGYSGFLHHDATEILLKLALNTITKP